MNAITIPLYRLFACRAMSELARLRPEEQKLVLRHAARGLGLREQLLMMSALFVLLTGWMCVIKYLEVPWLGLLTGLLVYGTVFTISWLGLLYILFRIQLPAFRRATAEYLSRRGRPTCSACGCDLRGIQATRCPECGHEFARQERHADTNE